MSGERAIAVRTAQGWVLKWLCPDAAPAAGAKALAVRAGVGWVLAPLGEAAGGRYLCVATSGQPALIPLGCPENGGEEPCTGNDGRCSICTCTAKLPAAFLVSLSGFPAVCGVEAFNGSWTLNWVADCVWQYDIDAERSVRLNGQEGPFWRVTWSVAGEGGISGYYGGQGGEGCAPESQEYCFWQVSNTAGCSGLLAALMNDVVVTVAVAE